MVVLTFLGKHILEILLSIATASVLGYCKHINNKAKEYKSLLAEKEEKEIDERIDEKLEPILDEIEELRAYIRNTKDTEKRHIDLIISSYKFRLTQLCKLYIKQGYMTQDQYDQVSEFYKLYRALGGNGQAEAYFKKIEKLEIRPE